MQSWNFTRRSAFFRLRKCQILWKPKLMICWKWNPISYMNKRFITCRLQWRCWCIGMKRFESQNVDNFTCTWMEPDKQQKLGAMEIIRRQWSNPCMESIKWDLCNASMSINCLHIITDICCRKSGLSQTTNSNDFVECRLSGCNGTISVWNPSSETCLMQAFQ